VSANPVTTLNAAGERRDMQEWITYGILAALLMLFFFFYLMIRRTVQGFKEGMRGNRK